MNEVHQTFQSTNQEFGRKAKLPIWANELAKKKRCIFCEGYSHSANLVVFPNHINKELNESTSYVEVILCESCMELGEMGKKLNIDTIVHFLIYQNKRAGKNQTALAEAIKVNQSQISRIKDSQVKIMHISTALSIYREFVKMYKDIVKNRELIKVSTQESFNKHYSTTGKNLISGYYKEIAESTDFSTKKNTNQSIYSCDFLVTSSRGKPLIASFIMSTFNDYTNNSETKKRLLEYAKILNVQYIALLNIPLNSIERANYSLETSGAEKEHIAFDSPKDIYLEKRIQNNKSDLIVIESLKGVIDDRQINSEQKENAKTEAFKLLVQQQKAVEQKKVRR
jgi:hypothetical protein